MGKQRAVREYFVSVPLVPLAPSHCPAVRLALEGVGARIRRPAGHRLPVPLRLRDEGELLEYASVFDHHYATSRSQVEKHLADNRNVILEIDWQGAQQVRASMPECVTIFILPPSVQELERRLRDRRTDSPEVIERRLRDALADREARTVAVLVDAADGVVDVVGLARALVVANEEYRTPLRKNGYLTRDSRMKERKKYGQRGARRKFQFSKR